MGNVGRISGGFTPVTPNQTQQQLNAQLAQTGAATNYAGQAKNAAQASFEKNVKEKGGTFAKPKAVNPMVDSLRRVSAVGKQEDRQNEHNRKQKDFENFHLLEEFDEEETFDEDDVVEIEEL